MNFEPVKLEIGKLEAAAGDCVVIKVDGVLSQEQLVNVRRVLQPLLPHAVKLMLIDDLVESVTVITAADIEKQSKAAENSAAKESL